MTRGVYWKLDKRIVYQNRARHFYTPIPNAKQLTKKYQRKKCIIYSFYFLASNCHYFYCIHLHLGTVSLGLVIAIRSNYFSEFILLRRMTFVLGTLYLQSS